MDIKPDFIIKNKQGLYCPYGDFYLDPQLPVPTAVISHAHNDHAKPGNQQVFCTAATAQIMQLRYKKNAAHSFEIRNYLEKFHIKEVKISFFPAGHILGSAMVLMEYQNIRYLFTGDYKLQPDDTCEPIQFTHADVLITETTFADPAVLHPNPQTEIEKLNDISSNIMLGVYALGKAQRINKLITDFCPDKKVLVHHSILPIHLLYQKLNINIGNFEPYNRKLMKKTPTNYIYLVPPVTFHSYQKVDNAVRIFASGWKNLQVSNSHSLYLSDHVDWNDILFTIDKVEPKVILTVHGDGRHLQKYFKDSKEVAIIENAY
jgi:putative mRNA 3-end processing factor